MNRRWISFIKDILNVDKDGHKGEYEERERYEGRGGGVEDCE